MKLLTRILHIIDNINEWIGKIFGSFIIILMGAVVYDTFMRYVCNSPTIWGMDLNKILLLAIVCLGGGYCLLHGGHVKVDILYLKFSPRKRALIDVFTHIFIIVFCYIVVKHGGSVAWNAFSIGETSSDSAWEYIMWPVLMLIPIAGVLLGLQTLAKWIRDLTIAITGKNKLESRVVRGKGGLRG
jgi:TRAP-type mannitol/chloroaromatic compound transport system permease small subunit